MSTVILCFLISIDCFCQKDDDICGVYEYSYPYATADLCEDQFLVLEKSGEGYVTGYYYGTTDEFDEAREGYLPGFFVAKMDSLVIKNDSISFVIRVSNNDFFTKPIPKIIRTSQEARNLDMLKWNVGNLRNTSKKYFGVSRNGGIYLAKDDSTGRLFVKMTIQHQLGLLYGDRDSTFEINSFLVSIQPSPKEITTIDESCGVFIPIDTMKIAKLKGSTPSDLDKFYTVADDQNGYFYSAREFLSGRNVKLVHPKTRYLQFTVSDSTVIFDATPVCANGWGYAILYKKGEMPIIIRTFDVWTSYKEYFTEK